MKVTCQECNEEYIFDKPKDYHDYLKRHQKKHTGITHYKLEKDD